MTASPVGATFALGSSASNHSISHLADEDTVSANDAVREVIKGIKETEIASEGYRQESRRLEYGTALTWPIISCHRCADLETCD